MWVLLVSVAFLLIGWGIVSSQRLLYPPRQASPITSSLVTSLGSPPDVDTITTFDHASCEVWTLSPQAPRALLLFCHGYFASHLQVVDLARRLAARGYACALFDLRGHGSRPGPCTFGADEAKDALSILTWAAARRPYEALPRGVIGWSMGGSVACQVALRGADVRAVVLDSTYARFFPLLQRGIWREYHLPGIPFAWVTWWSVQMRIQRRLAGLDPIAVAPQLHQPLLSIAGGADQRVETPWSEALYQRWAGSKERWFDPTAAHVSVYAKDPQAYAERVAAFLDRALWTMPR